MTRWRINMNREDRIQNLLRNAFRSLSNNGCNSSRLIQEFLTTDKKSISWGIKAKKELTKKVFNG